MDICSKCIAIIIVLINVTTSHVTSVKFKIKTFHTIVSDLRSSQSPFRNGIGYVKRNIGYFLSRKVL